MLRYHLNLATNPFVNYRKYYLIGVVFFLVGLGGAGYSVNRYLTLRQGNGALEQDLRLKQQEFNQLTARSSQLKEQLEQPQTLDELDRIGFYNLLIQRDTFPWTQFFQDLEAVIPYNVQVTQIRQKSSGQVLDLEMVFLGRSTVDAVTFLRNLTNSKKFHNIFVDQEGSFKDAATHRVSNEVEVTLHMQYEP
jgi:Tfp pilus assembly protein PilN